jgi:hypothetical protein
VAQNGALLIGLLFGYTLCYMPTLALTNNIAFHSLANVDKTFPVVRVRHHRLDYRRDLYRRDRHLDTTGTISRWRRSVRWRWRSTA